jgi:hypothetical protein
MDEEELKKKKELFQQEILNKQYNVDEFTEYIKQNTGMGEINFSNWSLEDMRNIIKNFQDLKEAPENQNSEKKEKSLEQMGYKVGEAITTKIANNVKLRNLNQDTFITGFEKENGIFTTNYLFKIEINDFNTTVKRNFNDFVWLKKTLEKFYPNTFIPPLPKMPFFKSYTDDFINKKMRYLNKFLTSLSHNILILSSDIFYSFLTSEKIEKLKEDYSAIEEPSSFKKLYTVEGILNITTGKEKDELAKKILKNIKKRDIYFNKLNTNLKDLINEFDVVCKKMKTVSKDFKNMAKVFDDNQTISKTFINYEKIIQTWSSFYSKLKISFNNDFKEFFKFFHEYSNSYIKYYDDYNIAKYKFASNYVYYENINFIGKKELKELNKLRKNYGFTINRLIDEYKQMNNIMVSNMKNQITKLEESYLEFNEITNCLNLLKEGINENPKNN